MGNMMELFLSSNGYPRVEVKNQSAASSKRKYSGKSPLGNGGS